VEYVDAYPPGWRPLCDHCRWCRTRMVAQKKDGTSLCLCVTCATRGFEARDGKEWRPDGDGVLYQVDLYGDAARLCDGRLSDMVRCVCRRCLIILLAEGQGHRDAVRLAEETGRDFVTLCRDCYRDAAGVDGELVRGIPGNPAHEAEFEAALRQLKAEIN
jgi:hypothetical protein